MKNKFLKCTYFSNTLLFSRKNVLKSLKKSSSYAGLAFHVLRKMHIKCKIHGICKIGVIIATLMRTENLKMNIVKMSITKIN